MKKIVGLLATLALASSLFMSCTVIMPSGQLVQKTYELSGFDKLWVESEFEVTVTQGSVWSVVAIVDQNIAEYVQIGESNGTLEIRRNGMVGSWGPIEMRVNVTMPAVDRVYLDGAAQANFIGFTASADALTVTTSGASQFNWNGGQRATSTIVASGASQVNFTDFVTTAMSATLSGASQLSGSAGSSKTDSLAVDLSGASIVNFDVVNAISGSLTGASILRYGLSPDLSAVNADYACVVTQR